MDEKNLIVSKNILVFYCDEKFLIQTTTASLKIYFNSEDNTIIDAILKFVVRPSDKKEFCMETALDHVIDQICELVDDSISCRLLRIIDEDSESVLREVDTNNYASYCDEHDEFNKMYREAHKNDPV